MSAIDWFAKRVSPGWALNREIAAARLDLLQTRRANLAGSYAPTGGRRSAEFHKNTHDAQMAMRGERATLTHIARDMLRNNPRVTRACGLISNYTIGAGIVPTVQMVSGEDDKNKSIIQGLIADHLMSTAIDADGDSTLFGLQKLTMRTIPTAGEVILRRRFRRSRDPFPLPFQVQVLETDHIVSTLNRQAGRQGNRIDEGVEYNRLNQRAAFHLYNEHPGGMYLGRKFTRVDASNVALSFDPWRPGQRRGVSWFGPVMPLLLDLMRLEQATLKRQEVAAMFAGILQKHGIDAPAGFDDSLDAIEAGGIMEVAKDEELTFNDPPDAVPAETVNRMIERTIAAALMLTYSSFSGDYSQTNYSASRAERNDQDPAVQGWQNHLMIGQQLMKLAGWFKEAVFLKTLIDPADYRLVWSAPKRPVVDPTKDWKALREKRDAGFGSRRGIIRSVGDDPEKVDAEILEERTWEKDNDIDFNPAATVDDNQSTDGKGKDT